MIPQTIGGMGMKEVKEEEEEEENQKEHNVRPLPLRLSMTGQAHP